MAVYYETKFLREFFGAEQMAAIEKKKATETLSVRKELAASIRKIEAQRDADLAKISPELEAASKREAAARKEFAAATNGLSCLRRRRSAVGDVARRKIGQLEQELRSSADPRIEEFVKQTHAMEQAVYHVPTQEKTEATDRPSGRWGVVAKIFSNRKSIEQRIEAIRSARQAAESLKLQAGNDVAEAIAKISETIPAGDLQLLPTGEEIPVPAL